MGVYLAEKGVGVGLLQRPLGPPPDWAQFRAQTCTNPAGVDPEGPAEPEEGRAGPVRRVRRRRRRGRRGRRGVWKPLASAPEQDPERGGAPGGPGRGRAGPGWVGRTTWAQWPRAPAGVSPLQSRSGL